ncbi:MAG: response regulator [Gemmatimonadales bacterium]
MIPPDAEILLAEDNPSDAELILATLGEIVDPSRLHRVHDGVEALAFLERSEAAGQRVGLVLLDIKLPRVDGLQVLERLRSTQAGRLVPVVMLTSSRIPRDVTAAYALGINGYVQKPVDFTRFREVMRCLGRFWLTINESPPLDSEASAEA